MTTESNDVEEAVMIAVENVFDGFSSSTTESLQNSIKLLKNTGSDKALEPFVGIKLVGMIRSAPNIEYLQKIMSVFVDSGFFSLEVFQRILATVSSASTNRNEENRKLLVEYISGLRSPFIEKVYRSAVKKAAHMRNIDFLQFIDKNPQIKLVGDLENHELVGLEYYRVQRMKETNDNDEPKEYELAMHILRRSSAIQIQ